MATVGKTKREEEQYAYARTVFLHPDVCRNVASHLLIHHPLKPVGHRNPQKKTRTGCIRRRAADTDRQAHIEAPM